MIGKTNATNGKPTQSKTLEFNPGSANSITITPDEGYVLSGVEVGKPTTMIPSNIKSGVNIGGVVGTYKGTSKPEQSKMLEFNPGSANSITITPDEGCVLSDVIVGKPKTMIPSNIKSGVNIGGVVGTYVGVPSYPQYDVTLNVNTFQVNDGELHVSYYINEETTPNELVDTTTINGVYCIKFQIISNVTAVETPIDISIRFYDDPMSSAIVYFDKFHINPIDMLTFDTANIFIGDNCTINIDITQG